MREDEINEGIQSICNLSKKTSPYLKDINALVAKLNSLNKEELNSLEKKYKSKNGPVNKLRTDILTDLQKGKELDKQIFESIIQEYRNEYKKAFLPFNNDYLIFQPFIYSHERENVDNFIEIFGNEIIQRLKFNDKFEVEYDDLKGRPHQGAEKFSLAVYDRSQKTEPTRLQFLIEFEDCMIKYGIKRQKTKNYTKGPRVQKSIDFDFESLIYFFKENKGFILKDEPEDEPKDESKNESIENAANFVLIDIKPQSEDKIWREFSHNIILYGPPGTGKTYNTIDLAVKIITGNKASHQENKKMFDALREEGQIEFITFHQNYSYEDFMIGIRPDLEENSTLKFRRKEGIFYRICKEAENNYLESQKQTEVSMNRYVLIIDEINRANISRVFGELITLLEEDKRLGAKNELRISIPGEETGFGIPPNVYVIGTMNTADKSIAMIDIALRRRFEFRGYFPDYSKVDGISGEILRHINNEIYNRKKCADYLIGHGYFMNGDEPPETSKVLENKVIPLLMEYFSGKTEVVEEIFKGSEWSVKYDTKKYGWEIEPQIKQ